jgi:PTH1 family peptidyl-tRNA hydrolase
MKLIIGLGNPGIDYQHTRHNLGFIAIDALAKRWALSTWKSDFQGLYIYEQSKKTILLKPQTFMNLSGESVLAIMQFYKIALDDIVVLYDDLALDPGVIRLRLVGSSGSHNGMQHVIDGLKTQAIKRIRIGIGAVPLTQKGKDYVLQPPTKTELLLLNRAIADVCDAVEDYLRYDFMHAMNRFNRGGQD